MSKAEPRMKTAPSTIAYLRRLLDDFTIAPTYAREVAGAQLDGAARKALPSMLDDLELLLDTLEDKS